MTSTTARGRAFEAQAARFLEEKGMRVVGRNVRTAGGELDVVAWDGALLVFVEVRTRRGRGGLDAAHSVTPKKQARVARAAAAFLDERGPWVGGPPRCRFDVVVDNAGAIAHIPDAFRIEG